MKSETSDIKPEPAKIKDAQGKSNSHLSMMHVIFFSVQHVLAMYAGTVAVPLLIGNALIQKGLFHQDDLPQLIVSDLFVSGLATVIQSQGLFNIGVRLPLIQGCTFASVSVMISTASVHGLGAMYGSIIACGIFMLLCAGYFAKFLRFFPPLVTGTVIIVIGLSLMGVAGDWIVSASDQQQMSKSAALGLSAWTMFIIIVIERFGSAAMQKISILLGIMIGTLTAIPGGWVDFSLVKKTPAHQIPHIFQFGYPQFNVSSIIGMLIVGVIIMTETSGDIIAVGEIVSEKITPQRLAAGLRADGLSTVLGGMFNAFPYTAFAQNIGLLSLSKITSRYVTVCAGIWLIILGFFPKLGALVSCIPQPVLGGAGLVLFGMVAANGLKTITTQPLDHAALLTVGVSIAMAMVPIVKPTIFSGMPSWFTTIFTSSVTLGTIMVVTLNTLFRLPAKNSEI